MSIHILIAEPDRFEQAVMQRTIEKMEIDADVVFARSILDSLIAAKTHTFHIAIIRIRLPLCSLQTRTTPSSMNGMQLAEELLDTSFFLGSIILFEEEAYLTQLRGDDLTRLRTLTETHSRFVRTISKAQKNERLFLVTLRNEVRTLLGGDSLFDCFQSLPESV